MSQRTPAASRAGFTLVEILVALLIMSLMMTAIIRVLTSARHVRDVVYNTQESQLAGPAILDLLEADLRGLFLTNRRTADILRVRDDAISGLDADRIDFVTSRNNLGLIPNASRTRYLRADVSEVGYCLRSNPDYDGEFLEIYRRESFGIDAEPFDGGTYTFLHDRVVRFDVLAFTEPGTDAEPLESWGIENADAEFQGLPHRIEIELELELAPRLLREQSSPLAGGKRKVVYRRIIAFPESSRLALDVRPVPRVPDIQPPAPEGGPVGPGSGPGTGGFTGSSSGTVTDFGGGGGPPPDVPVLGTSGGGGGGGGGLFGGGG